MQPGITAFSLLLRRYRGRARLSQEALADRAGVSVQTVGALERGVHLRPHVETVYALAGALRLSANEALLFERAAFQLNRHQDSMASRSVTVAADGVLVAIGDRRAPVSVPDSVQQLGSGPGAGRDARQR